MPYQTCKRTSRLILSVSVAVLSSAVYLSAAQIQTGGTTSVLRDPERTGNVAFGSGSGIPPTRQERVLAKAQVPFTPLP